MAVTRDKIAATRVKEALPETALDKASADVEKVLADTFVLYVMTLHCHWNVQDPRFIALHLLFEKQYEELAEAADTLAEHIRFSGRRAPSTLKEFLQLTSLKEIHKELSGDEMIDTLARGHEVIIAESRKGIKKAEKLDDQATADLLTDRLRAHQKMAWFLRSHLTEY